MSDDQIFGPAAPAPPHHHDIEETFMIIEGEIEATLRGVKSLVKAGETSLIPAKAPHHVHNLCNRAARVLCLCSPSCQENFFWQSACPSKAE